MIDKEFLLELFETQLKQTKVSSTYQMKKDWPCIKFETVYGEYFVDKRSNFSSLNECTMFIFNDEDKFYIVFNSIHVEISIKEYKRLKKSIDKKQKEQIVKDKKERYVKDEKLLDAIFSISVKNQKRKSLVEKTSTKS